ncbi:MAG: hypothetical protein ABH849_02965 [Nanoarchaeota archaeon]
MTRKSTEKKISITLVIAIILILFTWPRLQLNVKLGYEENIIPAFSNQATIDVWVWNRGAVIGNWYIITPESCISANVSENISCTHNSRKGVEDCNKSICSKTSALDTSPTHNIRLKFPEDKPNNFTLTIFSKSSFGTLNIKDLNRTFYCELKELDKYSCTE